jgi:hypothetical protein
LYSVASGILSRRLDAPEVRLVGEAKGESRMRKVHDTNM